MSAGSSCSHWMLPIVVAISLVVPLPLAIKVYRRSGEQLPQLRLGEAGIVWMVIMVAVNFLLRWLFC